MPTIKNYQIENTSSFEHRHGNEQTILNSNDEIAVIIEKKLSDFISTLFYNVLSKPRGYDLCLIEDCTGILQIIAKDLQLGLQNFVFR